MNSGVLGAIILAMYLADAIAQQGNHTSLRYGHRCKWSNEGCIQDKECCSASCEQRHPGTNPRCTKSRIGGPCLFSYHCDYRLECGYLSHICCAPYWGTCAEDKECCEKRHTCMQVRGFVYKKCLEPPMKQRASANTFMHSIITQLQTMWICIVHFLLKQGSEVHIHIFN